MFRDLTRKNKELTREECIMLLITEKRGVLSVTGDMDYPYGMPMNHFYDEKSGKIYFHCGKSGHRLDSVMKNNKASFCVYDKGEKLSNDWALTVNSVIVFGKIAVIDDREKTADISTKLSLKFTDDMTYISNEISSFIHETLLLELTPEHICGKRVTES